MAEITIQIPDGLTQHVTLVQSLLPAILTSLSNNVITDNAITEQILTAESQPLWDPSSDMSSLPLVYQEIFAFLKTRPTPAEILAFNVSDDAQSRLRDLLDRNRDNVITPVEVAELDLYEQLNHLMHPLKVKSYVTTQACNS
jgi:hypothetical protein